MNERPLQVLAPIGGAMVFIGYFLKWWNIEYIEITGLRLANVYPYLWIPLLASPLLVGAYLVLWKTDRIPQWQVVSKAIVIAFAICLVLWLRTTAQQHAVQNIGIGFVLCVTGAVLAAVGSFAQVTGPVHGRLTADPRWNGGKMEVKVREQDGIVIYTVTGEVEARPTEIDEFLESVQGYLCQGARGFVVDIFGMKWMHDRMWGALIRAHTMILKAGGHARYVPPPPVPPGVIVELDFGFLLWGNEPSESVDEAIAAVKVDLA